MHVFYDLIKGENLTLKVKNNYKNQHQQENFAAKLSSEKVQVQSQQKKKIIKKQENKVKKSKLIEQRKVKKQLKGPRIFHKKLQGFQTKT